MTGRNRNNDNNAKPPVLPVRRSRRHNLPLEALEFPHGLVDTPRRSRSTLTAVTEAVEEISVIAAPEAIFDPAIIDIIKEEKENDDGKLPAVQNNDNKATAFIASKVVAEEESTATFEPVIQLEEVEVNSGEEEEEVLCSYRSKLFLFGETLLDQGTGKKTWMERGVGDARILRHRGNGRLRFLMRREETKKVIANHALDPRIKLESNAGSDRSWVWSCSDFSDGKSEEKSFALKFKDSKLAQEFKAKFEECQAEMARLLAGEDAPSTQGGGGGGGEAEDLATALGGLSTKDDE